MEWLAGETLNQHVARRAADPVAMRALSGKFLRLCGELARHNMAHGDLQHGNILVVDGELRLIDYDGMYVPGLEGLGTPELGHRNYQHPRRAGADFGPSLDHFSAWIIHLSLLALSLEPALWSRLSGGDENLLFRREDFDAPDNSDAVEALRRIRDGQGDVLAERFLEAVHFSPSAVPPLEELPLPPPGGIVEQPAGAPEWVRAQSSETGAVEAVPVGASVPEWLVQAEPVEVRLLEGPFHLERASAGLLAGGLLLLLYFGFASGTPLVMLSLLVVAQLGLWAAYLGLSYRLQRTVRERGVLVRRLAERAQTLQALERQISTLREQRAALDDKATKMAPEDLARLEKAELEQIETGLQQALAGINTRRQASLTGEAEDIEKAIGEALVGSATAVLQQHSVASAPVNGLNEPLRRWLAQRGVVSAADVTSAVALAPEVGPVLGAGLLAWRRGIEERAQRAYAAGLPPEVEAPIRARHEADRSVLDLQETQARDAAKQKKQALRAKYRGEQTRATAQADTAEKRETEARKGLDAQIAALQRELPEKQVAYARARHEMEGFHDVRFSRYVQRMLSLPSPDG
jgi:hypothetical protein